MADAPRGVTAPLSPAAAARLAAAQNALRAGDKARNKSELEAALRAAPGHPVTLNAMAVRLLGDGDTAQAVDLLTRAVVVDPRAPELWLNLAKAHRLRDAAADERAALDQALAIDRRHFAARLRSAEWHERAGATGPAAADWSAVLQLAAALAPQEAARAEPLLTRARRAVADWQGALALVLDADLASHRAQFAPAERRRFEACVDAALGRRRVYHNEPFGMHFPFLPAEEFFPRDMLPFLPDLERHAKAIREETMALLGEGGSGFAPYVANPPGTPRDKWSELDHSTRWSALYLYKYGAADRAALERFPATAAALATLPLADMPGRAPTAFFSLLKAGTRIPPHTGVTNTRAIIHLPLVVPPGCGFRVGGETREWREGEAFGFDDTIEHEAWNDSDQPRVVLILDVWNPYLTDAERRLLRAYFAAADASGLTPDPRD